MKDKKMEEFLNKQDKTIDNIGSLRVSLSECIDSGLQDIDDALYNELSSLEDDAKIAENDVDLAAVISRAKTIEKKLDNWYASLGISTLELNWPNA